MKNWKSLILTAAMLAMLSSVQNARAQSPSPSPNYVRSSPTLDIRANVAEPPALAGGMNTDGKVHPDNRISADTTPTPPANAGGSPLAACMAAAVELERSRILISA